MPTRRQVLQVAAVAPLATLAACSSSDQTQVTDADDAVRAEVGTGENELIKRYDATIAAYPSLAGQLRPIRDQHGEHLAAVGGSDAPVDLKGVVVPKTAAAAVNELAAAERSAANARRASCVKATGSELVWDLTLIATSESQHAAALAKGVS